MKIRYQSVFVPPTLGVMKNEHVVIATAALQACEAHNQTMI